MQQLRDLYLKYYNSHIIKLKQLSKMFIMGSLKKLKKCCIIEYKLEHTTYFKGMKIFQR